jgi:hypothetical protein
MLLMSVDSRNANGSELFFCPRGNELAHEFLRAAENAVRLSDVAYHEELRYLVHTGLDRFLQHRGECGECNED